MASPQQQLLSESDDVVDKSDDVRDLLSDVQVEESQLQNVLEVDEGLSQHGDQEAVNETQLDDDRPSSAGADGGMVPGADNGNVSHDAAGNDRTSDDQVHSDDITLLKRPDSAGKAGSQPAFSFGKPNLAPMNFTGTRKGPALGIVATTEGTDTICLMCEVYVANKRSKNLRPKPQRQLKTMSCQ